MNYKYLFSKTHIDKTLWKEINYASDKLHKKLSGYDVNKVSKLSDEIKNYFQHKLTSLNTNLIKYSYHLAWVIKMTDKPIQECVIVDHGGGTGMFGMLAKELGVKTVIYNDINEQLTENAEWLAKELNLTSDYYVHGDIDELSSFLHERSIRVNGIVSYNVIEHIYDIISFFRQLKEIPFDTLSVFMSTGANQFNPWIKKEIVTTHINAETGRDFNNGNNYFQIRKKIIHSYKQILTIEEVTCLAKATRGLIEADIRECVDEYLITKKIPNEITHSTNTCDPYTGSWAEHLMNPFQIIKHLKTYKIYAKITSGYYGNPNNKLKRYIGFILNGLIRILGVSGIIIAPFWSIKFKLWSNTTN